MDISMLTMFGSFFLLIFLGVPVAFSIGIATIITLLLTFPFDVAVSIAAQRMATGLDSFTLLAIPFFILAGTLMSSGGIARRLIDFAQVLVGRLPGSLSHVNIMSNMMFGAISGSAVAAAAAVGGTLGPIQQRQGYPPAYSTAVNVSSCVTGLLIPPSNVLIVYSLTSGGVSIATLFMAGYVPGILMGLGLMLTGGIIARRRGYPTAERPTLKQAMQAFLRAIPSLMMIVVVIGGILGGVFTATEASAIAVVYTFVLSVLIYREVSFRELPTLILESVVMTSVVLLLIGLSVSMSWAMNVSGIPEAISETLLSLSSNPIVILLMINLALLIVGIFMDMTPAVLIFTPIFLPIATQLGIDPVHFGIMMVFNLCIGLLTPPVGSALFVGCSVSGVKLQHLIRPLLPFYIVLVLVLLAVTFIPALSLGLPRLFGLK
ncbi:TRAP transporter large permease [Kushneria indalinina]|uniref:TRAP transporter large permease protein n=1 Tax=Kushneria indalinina DSM 14324 TaxID=1122140 RepID=A0A3D9DWY8_9GAMM|nr:TRAP transporter large permease subunit [Kushneria indalinina]REC95201.1 tripartite ATP-independent transporter DctM subunit [Kushneria indalinina DSM 14324]